VILGRLDGRRLPSAILATGLVVYAGFVVALGLAPSFAAGLVALGGVGGGFLMVIATNNSCIQHLSSDAMRGRVMGIWLMSFGLFNPLGVLVQGVLADAIGIRWVLAIDGVLLVLFLVWSVATHRLRRLDTAEATANLNVGPVDAEENP
jgi:MFS family permease